MRYALLGGIALASAAAAQPQQDPAAARDAAERAAFAAMPDTPGTGPYPALKEVDPRLADHVVYRPADLGKLGKRKLGLLVWGNGGCRDDGASARQHLAQIASYGYLAIAPGRLLSGPGAVAAPAPREIDAATGKIPPVATTAEDVRAGIDWALAENARKGSAYYRRIDPKMIAVSGTSCGGLQALQVAGDPRISAVIVHNSGVFTDGSNPIQGMTVDKSLLKTLHTPVLYVLGGKGDVAYPNGTDDFRKIDHVPAMLLNLDVGHGGTLRQHNGGPIAKVDVDWLQWQLRGDDEAAKTFLGKDCRLCTNPKWTVEKKGID
jgi:dienelactone hydrolase